MHIFFFIFFFFFFFIFFFLFVAHIHFGDIFIFLHHNFKQNWHRTQLRQDFSKLAVFITNVCKQLQSMSDDHWSKLGVTKVEVQRRLSLFFLRSKFMGDCLYIANKPRLTNTDFAKLEELVQTGREIYEAQLRVDASEATPYMCRYTLVLPSLLIWQAVN